MDKTAPLELGPKPITIPPEQRIWFTSDTHFGHRNIMTYCDRPGSTIEDHDEMLIENWNAVVGEDDIVFHLGDFAFAPDKRWKELVKMLNGHIYLILGNHDIVRWPGRVVMSAFDGVAQQAILKIEGRTVILNHYPFLCYGGTYKGEQGAVWQLFGHVHTKDIGVKGQDDERVAMRFPYQYDVGVDNNGYAPISWGGVKAKIEAQYREYVKQEYVKQEYARGRDV